MRFCKYLIFFSFCFSSCSLFENSELEVSYIHFNRPNHLTTVEQGSNVHNIKDLWIEMDADDLGVFPTDKTVPFLPQSNESTIFVFAGIKNNGIQTDAVIYPFYDFVEIEKTFVPGEIDTMTLDFEYKPETLFSFVEDFDGGLLFARDEDEDPDSGMTIQSQSGNNYGEMIPSEEHPQIGVSNIINYNDIPLNSQPVYLELEYRNNTPFTIGIIGQLTSDTDFTNVKILITPKEEWNKIYIDFTNEVNLSQLNAYRIVFATVWDENGVDDQFVHIDNVKLLHF